MRERDSDKCQDCGSPPLPDGRRCQTCKDLHALREAARREERRRLGLCVPCGKRAVVDEDGVPMTLCDDCRAKYEARRLATKRKRERERRKQQSARR
jgi:hypothetical protein